MFLNIDKLKGYGRKNKDRNMIMRSEGVMKNESEWIVSVESSGKTGTGASILRRWESKSLAGKEARNKIGI